MKFFIAFAVLFVCVAARPGTSDHDAVVIVQNQDSFPDGRFTNELKVDNGISQSAVGELKNVPGAEQPSSSVTGEYTQFDAEGKPHVVSYVADETGYHAHGDLIPVAP